MSELEKLRPKAVRLIELGFTYRQTADALGITKRQAWGLVNDTYNPRNSEAPRRPA
jgi:hypothetical protein